jgi:hypothetical protein
VTGQEKSNTKNKYTLQRSSMDLILMNECINNKNCHHLKPFGLAGFTEAAAL